MATPLGVAILSQSCDVVVPHNRPNLVVAAVVQLHGEAAKEAIGGMRPRYVYLPAFADMRFADLEYTASVPKSIVSKVGHEAGVDPHDWSAVRQLSLAIGRRFSRFAFPDEIVPWLENLTGAIQSKYSKPASALGRAFNEVREVRVQAPSWDLPQVELTIHIILNEGELPDLGDEPLLVSDQLNGWLASPRDHNQIAERLFPSSGGRPQLGDREKLWRAFAASISELCHPKVSKRGEPGVATAVREVTVQIVSEEEFSLATYRRSEQLDLGYLSPPTPHTESL